ncbi:MAG TPA: LpqB family beta-propeller domain-containing protein [Streptosporangiaceae bacterium]|nr:LpqB family beta-propeller domain-containing protein [Streptosporangiaceae bacterium]
MPDPRLARVRRPGRRTVVVTALVVAAALASGCSVIPAGNGPQPASVPGPPPGGGPCCGLLVRPPQAGWQAPEVVSNFLLASAIVAHNYRVAREYLTGDAVKSWHPGTGVIILAKEPTLSYQGRRGITEQGGKQSVLVTGQELARLSNTGQYIPVPGGASAPTEEFTLRTVNGILKIATLSSGSGKPSREVLLTNDLFHLVYAPRNLYYLGGRNGQLLPYPVYVPSQGTGPAATLVRDLINGPSGWLQGAARTAFPPESHLAGPIQVFPGPSGGRTALVNIDVPPHSVGLNERAIALQVVATLTSSSYGAPLFRAVKIEINGRLWPPQHPGQALGQSFYQRYIPHAPAGTKAYYLSQDGGLRTLAASSARGTAVIRASGTGQVALSRIAISPRGNELAGLSGPANTLYTGSLVTSKDGQRQTLGQLHVLPTGSSFTSLSWDDLGDLWVTGRVHDKQGVWVLLDGQAPAVPVQPPPGADRVTALRVAPDGNRVAMIVRSGTSLRLELAAIRHDSNGFWLTSTTQLGPSLPTLTALTWFGEDHLLVVTGSGSSSQLWQVPVHGGSPTSLVKTPGILTVTAAGPRNPYYVGLAGNRLEEAAGPYQPLGGITAGQAIIYPG